MAFRKQISLALALTMVMVCFGCADEIGAPIEDEQPVLPPTNVRALALNDGHVEVLWDASSQPNINGYNIYRREVGHGNPNRLNPTRILDTKYRDTGTVPAKDYEYRVTAVNSKGKESRHTSVVVETHAVIDDGQGRIPTLNTD
jgi:fibronectin type 3 domain-containing protein